MRKQNITPAPYVTGATGVDPSLNTTERDKIQPAAIWLSEQREKPASLVPYLKAHFQLSAVEACEVIALARRFEINRKAFS